MTSTPEQGKQYSLLKLAQTGEWSESEVDADATPEQKLAEGSIELVAVSDKTNEELEAEENFRPGMIWNTSWGYDQTNVEYFQVVRESKASVWLRQIGRETRSGRVFPVKDRFLDDDPKGHLHRKQRYTDRNGTVHVHLRIDYVRLAWPYEGGGEYDTIAAGGAGH